MRKKKYTYWKHLLLLLRVYFTNGGRTHQRLLMMRCGGSQFVVSVYFRQQWAQRLLHSAAAEAEILFPPPHSPLLFHHGVECTEWAHEKTIILWCLATFPDFSKIHFHETTTLQLEWHQRRRGGVDGKVIALFPSRRFTFSLQHFVSRKDAIGPSLLSSSFLISTLRSRESTVCLLTACWIFSSSAIFSSSSSSSFSSFFPLILGFLRFFCLTSRAKVGRVSIPIVPCDRHIRLMPSTGRPVRRYTQLADGDTLLQSSATAIARFLEMLLLWDEKWEWSC